MNTIKRIFTVIVFTMIVSTHGWAAPTVMDILKKMEEIEFLGSDVIVKMTFTRQRNDEGARVLESVFYRRDTDDSFLMVMTDPTNEKGNGYLRVGENMWMYRRNARTFQKMSRYQPIAGTDSRATDFEKRKYTVLFEPILDDNGQEILAEETLGSAGIPVYRLEVRAKVKDLEFPREIYWVNKENFLLMKAEQYSISGTHMMTSYFTKYATIEGKFIPSRILIVNEFEKGNKTLVELSQVALEPVDDDVFTKAYLENLSK